jgi:hypothetical protein
MGLAERAPIRLALLGTLPRKGGRGKAVARFRPEDTDKVVADGIKLYNQRSIVEERSIGSHGHFF